MCRVSTHRQTRFSVDAGTVSGKTSSWSCLSRCDLLVNDVMASVFHALKMRRPCPCSANLIPLAASTFNVNLSRGLCNVSTGTWMTESNAVACINSTFLDLFH